MSSGIHFNVNLKKSLHGHDASVPVDTFSKGKIYPLRNLGGKRSLCNLMEFLVLQVSHSNIYYINTVEK